MSVAYGTSLASIYKDEMTGGIFFNPRSDLYRQLDAIEDISHWRNAVVSRIKKKNKLTIKKIQDMEEAWDRYCYTGDFSELYEITDTIIDGCINRYLSRFSSYMLSEADFKGEFWGRAWKNILDYDGTGDFFLYETIIKSIYSRGKDIIKTARKRRQWFSGWKEYYDQTISDKTNIEKDVTDNLLVEQLMSDCKLTAAERKFLQIVYDNPGISLENIRKLMGLSHKETTRRMLNRIKEKLSYYPYVETAFWGKPWNTKENDDIYLLPPPKKKKNSPDQKPELDMEEEDYLDEEIEFEDDILLEDIYTEEKPYA